MKTFLALSNGILLLIILFLACDRKGGRPVSLQGDSCLTNACNKLINSVVLGEEEKISWSLAKYMADSYAADNGKKFINDGSRITKMEDALSVTFSVEKLKLLIWQIEQKTCRRGCDTSYRLGIRFYYAKYPSVVGPSSPYTDLRNLPAEYANKHTLFMTAAYLKNDRWFDFDPFGRNGCPGAGPADSSRYMFFTVTPGTSTPGDQDNHGGIAPPPDGVTFPITEYYNNFL